MERITGSPVLGRIARDADAGKRPLIMHDAPHDPRAESFRALRTNLQLLDVDAAPRIFVVSSASPDESKTTTTTASRSRSTSTWASRAASGSPTC